jgi:hypothetical protein
MFDQSFGAGRAASLTTSGFGRGTAFEDPPGWERCLLGKSFGMERAALLATRRSRRGTAFDSSPGLGVTMFRKVLRDLTKRRLQRSFGTRKGVAAPKAS